MKPNDFDDEFDRHNWIDSFRRLGKDVQGYFLLTFGVVAIVAMIICGAVTCDPVHRRAVPVYDCSALDPDKLTAYMEQCKKNYPTNPGRSYIQAGERRYPELMCKPVVLPAKQEQQQEEGNRGDNGKN